jgi:RHS repeat-associated protein
VLATTSQNGTPTDTVYFDTYTETVISGSSTTTTKYYSVNGQRLAEKVGSSLSFLISDLSGNVVMAVTSVGTVTAVELYEPYGQMNYAWGTMPTAHTYTGQRLESQSGLLYYNFRWYDPLAGVFVRTDDMQDNSTGDDPYAYVWDDPEGMTDPTGQWGISIPWGWGWLGAGEATFPELVIPTILVIGLIWVGGDVINNFVHPTQLDCGCVSAPSASLSGPPVEADQGDRATAATWSAIGNAVTTAAAAAVAAAMAGAAAGSGSGSAGLGSGSAGSGSGPGSVISPINVITGTVVAATAIAVAFAKKPRSDTYNQVEDKQWRYILQQIARRIGRRLTKDEERQLHDEISQMKFDVEEIIEIGVSMFGGRSGGWKRDH